MKLSEKVRAAYDRCKLFPELARNPDGTFTVKGDAYVALIQLRNLAPEIETALAAREGEQEQNVSDRRTVRRNSVAPPPADKG